MTTTIRQFIPDLDKRTVQVLCTVLMDLNNHPEFCSSCDAYGAVRIALSTFIQNSTGLDISGLDWNLGGNATFLHDIEAAVATAYDEHLATLPHAWEAEIGDCAQRVKTVRGTAPNRELAQRAMDHSCNADGVEYVYRAAVTLIP